MKLSAVVLTKNEEKNISDCIKKLAFCDEVIVVDDNSSDNTRNIARKLGAYIYKREMDMNNSAQSNFGMEKAKGDWILFVDADERVSESLKKEILEKTKNDSVSGFFIRRLDYIWGKWLQYGEVGSTKLLRLVREGCGEWTRRVHPVFNLQGESSQIQSPILHYPHKNLFKFIESIDRWSTWHALANKEEGKKSNMLKVVFWPSAHFFRNYFLRLGFLDGLQGFIFAIVMSFHSYLSWSKLLLLQKKGLQTAK